MLVVIDILPFPLIDLLNFVINILLDTCNGNVGCSNLSFVAYPPGRKAFIIG